MRGKATEKMVFFENLKVWVKSYPYRQRLPMAVILLLLTVWDYHKTGQNTSVGVVMYCSFATVWFFGPRGRPFWFLLGVAAGAIMVHELAIHHVFPAY